jgi:GT2 family glycosyltransferase
VAVVSPRLAVCIVTHDDAADLPACLASVAALTTRPLEVVVVDCASGDDSVAAARAFEPPPDGRGAVRMTVVPLAENRGFAGGMNEAIARLDRDRPAPWVLTLNADARPAPDYAERLIARAEALTGRADRVDRVGAVTGRLVRFPDPGDPEAPRRLDACGMYLVPTWRHLDRGSGEIDRPGGGRYDRPAKVFGATGAASLFARQALDDVAVPDPGGSQVFDERYHSFREDAELAFRLRERGWEVLYEPEARCEHRRSSLPETRAAMPPAANYHSLKNRYLLRIDHQTAGNLWRTLIPTLWRDLLALGHVLLRERTSLPAYAWLWRNRKALREHRRIVQGRRTVPPEAIDRWFRVREIPLDPP